MDLKLSKELKKGIEILIGQVVFKLWIKTVKIMFWSINQESPGLLKIFIPFLSPWTIYSEMYVLFLIKVLIILR